MCSTRLKPRVKAAWSQKPDSNAEVRQTPDRVTAIITQNGDAYEEGLADAWAPIRKCWAELADSSLRSCASGAKSVQRWESPTGTRGEIMRKENELIRKFRSSDPAVGYNRHPTFKTPA